MLKPQKSNDKIWGRYPPLKVGLILLFVTVCLVSTISSLFSSDLHKSFRIPFRHIIDGHNFIFFLL